VLKPDHRGNNLEEGALKVAAAALRHADSVNGLRGIQSSEAAGIGHITPVVAEALDNFPGNRQNGTQCHSLAQKKKTSVTLQFG
jgi:hypothetical protein